MAGVRAMRGWSAVVVVWLAPWTRHAHGDLTANGRLTAVDGAMRAASLAGSIVAVCCENDGVAVATGKRDEERSLRAYPVQRTWHVDEGIAVSAVGLMSDAHMVADFAFEQCVAHRATYGTPPSPIRLATSIADILAAAARQSRPLGVHVVVAAAPSVLCHVDPAGRLRTARALAAGNDADALTRHLVRHLADAPPLDGPDLLRRVWRDAARDAARDSSSSSEDDDDDESSAAQDDLVDIITLHDPGQAASARLGE